MKLLILLAILAITLIYLALQGQFNDWDCRAEKWCTRIEGAE